MSTNIATATKMETILMDEEISAALLKATSFKEIVEILRGQGIEATEEELEACGNDAMAILRKDGYMDADGELDERVLEHVVGGIGGKVMLVGAGMMALALASDFLAGACAVALVSNPAGWFIGGVAVLVFGAYLVSKKK